MAKRRKFVAYRRLERPYTRKSKYREKSFIRGNPHNKIIRYQMGNPKKDFDFKISICATTDLQIRACALESGRLILNRHLEKKIGPGMFYFRIKVYPHHHLRENALASGAGADRLSTGMKFSFGKVIDVAAQVKEGQPIYEVYTTKAKFETSKAIAKMVSVKMPCTCKLLVEPLK